MSERITVMINGKPRLAIAGLTLSEIINGERPCGGHGKCGKCRVIVKGALSAPSVGERALLGDKELERGVRLACLTYALGDCEITTRSETVGAQIVTDGALPEFEREPMFAGYGVAVDIGTTTLAARLYDTEGEMLAEASRLNPQQEWGADVISRIEAALGGGGRLLADSIRQALDGMISELADLASVQAEEIDGAVITGNTVMLSLLTEQSVEPFSHAPFAAERLFGETLTAEQLDLRNLLPNTRVYLPPCISAFVGADTTCAILATGLCRGDTAMLADIGTNGEMALWHDGRLTVCSTAAGPAFEGVGISMGMRGAEGAIDRVEIENRRMRVHVIGNEAPVGICGSGLVDAVACMLDLGVMEEDGYLEDAWEILAPVCLTPKDIRMLQLAKSAICGGLLTLTEEEGLTVSEVAALYVAGGFGNYLSKEGAARIGLLPRDLAQRTETVGNASLGGACMLLLSAEAQRGAEAVAAKARVLDLATNATFMDLYVTGMMLEEI